MCDKDIWGSAWDFQQCGMCDQQSLRSACARSLIRAIACRLNILLVLSYWLNTIWGFLSLKGSCTDSSEPTLVKMPHCWKSRVTAHMYCTRSGQNSTELQWEWRKQDCLKNPAINNKTSKIHCPFSEFVWELHIWNVHFMHVLRLDWINTQVIYRFALAQMECTY